jgi:hypothetical protein
LPAVQLVIFTVVAAAFMVISYAFGQGGPVAGLVFFTILFIGAVVRLTRPLRERLKQLVAR